MNLELIDVTAIVVNYNTKDLIRPCIDALLASAAGLRLQIVIVENGSRDGSADFLRAEFAELDLLINTTNVGFGRANNQAVALARGQYVLLLNTDAFVAAESLERTVRYMDEHGECGLLGVRLVGRDGALQPSCRYFPTPWNVFIAHIGLSRFFPSVQLVDNMNWDHSSPRACDWVPGCYYLVRKIVVDQVGLFDPRFFLYYEEVDHCRAVKAAGWQVMYYSETTVVHIGGESAKSDSELTANGRQISALQIESALLYFRKHHGSSGLWLSVVLGSLVNTLQAVKYMLKKRSIREALPYWTNTVTTWSLMRKTGWGHRPTR